jgi:hypothetical protein
MRRPARRLLWVTGRPADRNRARRRRTMFPNCHAAIQKPGSRTGLFSSPALFGSSMASVRTLLESGLEAVDRLRELLGDCDHPPDAAPQFCPLRNLVPTFPQWVKSGLPVQRSFVCFRQLRTWSANRKCPLGRPFHSAFSPALHRPGDASASAGEAAAHARAREPRPCARRPSAFHLDVRVTAYRRRAAALAGFVGWARRDNYSSRLILWLGTSSRNNISR